MGDNRLARVMAAAAVAGGLACLMAAPASAQSITDRIEELPVRSRNYLEFVLLAPGVTRTQPQAAPGGASSTLSDSGFSFGGLRPRSNTLTIDGLDNNDEFTGATRTELSLEFVREFQVVSNGWAVENGGAAAGGINVVTKSGVNTLHGDAFLFGQSGTFNASPKLEETFGNTPSLWGYRGGLAEFLRESGPQPPGMGRGRVAGCPDTDHLAYVDPWQRAVHRRAVTASADRSGSRSW